MASVWLGEDLVTGEPVAVKVLGRDLWAGPAPHSADARSSRNEALKRFERERQILEKLGGPGIPSLLHHDFRCGEPYLAMERISGKNLREFLTTHRPPLAASAAIGVQILETLARIHTAGIVHRDLKPANVLLAEDGTVYIIDFGIALPTDPEATRHTQHGPTPGSVGYKAPEIIRGVKNPTPAADVYGFACMLYEFVTARQVFKELPDRSIEDQHRNDPPPRLDPERHSVPADLADLIYYMLGKDPACRPTVADGLKVLRGHLPRPGDPAPSPRLHPDPTMVFRIGHASQPAPAAPAPVHRRRPVVRRRLKSSRLDFDDLLSSAEREMTEHGPGAESEHIAMRLTTVCEDWGPRDRLVVRARLLCADRARLEGDWPGAGSLYRTVERALRDTDDPEEKEFLLEARVGVAECLVPEEDDTDAAFRAWKDVVVELIGMARPYARVLRRCREFAAELSERGHRDEVAALLAGHAAG
jgi:serine/threonine protein kinase